MRQYMYHEYGSKLLSPTKIISSCEKRAPREDLDIKIDLGSPYVNACRIRRSKWVLTHEL